MKLTKVQITLLDILKQFSLQNKFYWTGGTLLAYHYLHHRYSYDLDFFSGSQFSYQELIPYLEAVKKHFNDVKIEEHKIIDRWELIIHTQKETTRIEFVWYKHEKKRIRPLENLQGINIDSLDDIAANKTMAYFDRNEPKDLFDLYTLLTNKNYTVQQLLNFEEQKFGAKFTESMFWTESAKILPLLNALNPYIIADNNSSKQLILKKIKEYFLKKGGKYIESLLE
ncbi:MAG: nucleotidyl transferase AbiEii/AbiGii toxin family protein [bacterium]|nr:nucleotidyl transferase AbiEii/AbiGii toxin family protein [bacterium]